MDDLIARIRAAINEDEHFAQQAIAPGGSRGEWAYGNRRISDDLGVLVVGHIPANRGRHIAHYDPARVLRQVAAHREILTEIERELADDNTNETMLWFLRTLAEVYGIEP